MTIYRKYVIFRLQKGVIVDYQFNNHTVIKSYSNAVLLQSNSNNNKYILLQYSARIPDCATPRIRIIEYFREQIIDYQTISIKEMFLYDNELLVLDLKPLLLDNNYLHNSEHYNTISKKIDTDIFNFNICYECKGIFDVEDLTEHNNDFYCEECFSENFISCYECGDIIDINDCLTAEDNFYCEFCFDNRFSRCDNCSDIHSINDMYNYNGHYYCNGCYCDLVGCCDNCGDHVLNEELYYSDSDDYYYCSNCYNSRNPALINSYSYKPEPEFAKMHYENTLYMGFELEIESKNNTKDIAEDLKDFLERKKLEDRIYFKDDSSLDNGFEIVTHPTTLKKYHTYNIKSLLDRIKHNKATSYDNNRCGLHIHINKEFFTDSDIGKLQLFFNKNYNNIKRFSKRTTEKLGQYADIENIDIMDYLSRHRHYRQNDSRYTAINVTYTTIEIRVFRGTLNHDRFLATLQFCDAISHFIKDISAISLTWQNFKDWLRTKNRYNHLENYLKKQGL